MERQDVINKLTEFLKKALADRDAKIKPEDSFVDDLGLDSAGHLEFFLMLEEEYGIEYEDEDEEEEAREAIKSLNDAVDLVLRKAGS